MCLFTRPHRPTGRMNREPSLKLAKRNNHNVSLEEKTWSISCCSLLCLSQLNFNCMCYFCDEPHAFHSAPEYIDLQCDVQSAIIWWVIAHISCDNLLNPKAPSSNFCFIYFYYIAKFTKMENKKKNNISVNCCAVLLEVCALFLLII